MSTSILPPVFPVGSFGSPIGSGIHRSSTNDLESRLANLPSGDMSTGDALEVQRVASVIYNEYAFRSTLLKAHSDSIKSIIHNI